MEQFTMEAIGFAAANEEGYSIEVEPRFREALKGLEGFSHVQVLWWFSQCGDGDSRSVLTEWHPYQGGPDSLGVFATRSPRRPNPIALSCAAVVELDPARGILRLGYLDALDGTPVLDIKPYTPSLDRVESPQVPAWCSHWPKDLESSGSFDWEEVFPGE